jgi:hypothetical protein
MRRAGRHHDAEIIAIFAVCGAATGINGCKNPSQAGQAGGDAGAPAPPSASVVASASATASAKPVEPPWDPHLGKGSLGTKYVALGNHLVDAVTGKRARGLPEGEITFAKDGEHFVVVGPRVTVVGSATSEADDLRAPITAEADADAVIASPNGRAVLLNERGRLFVLDGAKKTSTQVVRDGDADATDSPRQTRVTSADGRWVAWTHGAFAYLRDLDAATTRNWKVDGKTATSVELGEGVLAARFDDELVVIAIGSGAEIVRKKPVSDAIVAENGKTIAWEEGPGKQSFVVFDVDKKKELGHAGPGPQDKGVCGGGAFHLQELTGTKATLGRECSLIDILRIDLVSGAAWAGKRMESHTPGEDFEEEQAAQRAAKKAGVEFPGRPGHYALLWVDGRKKIVLPAPSGEKKVLALFDAATGKRVCEYAGSAEQAYDEDLALVPSGKTLAGIDGNDVARLWELATCKVLFEQKAK